MNLFLFYCTPSKDSAAFSALDAAGIIGSPNQQILSATFARELNPSNFSRPQQATISVLSASPLSTRPMYAIQAERRQFAFEPDADSCARVVIHVWRKRRVKMYGRGLGAILPVSVGVCVSSYMNLGKTSSCEPTANLLDLCLLKLIIIGQVTSDHPAALQGEEPSMTRTNSPLSVVHHMMTEIRIHSQSVYLRTRSGYKARDTTEFYQ